MGGENLFKKGIFMGGFNVWRRFLAFVVVFCSGGAFACVEGASSDFGTVIKNSCPYSVNLSFCFGSECDPPRESLVTLLPGFEKRVSDRKQNVRFIYCRSPERPSENGCRKQ